MNSKYHWRTLISIVVTIAVSTAATGIASAISPDHNTLAYSNLRQNEHKTRIDNSDTRVEPLTSDISNASTANDSSELRNTSQISVTRVEQVEGQASVTLHKDNTLSVNVSAVVDHSPVTDSIDVVNLVVLDADTGDYYATLRSRGTGELLKVNTTLATPQAFPVLVVLGAVARIGIKAAIKQYTKTQIKKSAKTYLLNNLNTNSWNHIMQAKHNWSIVGAKSREEIAEIIANAMTHGTHKGVGQHVQVTYLYKTKKVIVRYAQNGGQISDAWVVK